MIRKLLIVAALVLLTAIVVMAADGADYRSASAIEVAAKHLNFGADLKLDPGTELSARSVVLDEIGMSHVRYQQYYRGVRVFGGDAIAHVSDADVRVVGFTDMLLRGIQMVDIRPSISAETATGTVLQDMAPRGAVRSTSELVIYPIGRQYRMAQLIRVEVRGDLDTRDMIYAVDARTGKVIDRWDDLHTATGTGNSQYSGTVSLNTNLSGGSYEMRDLTRGNGGNTTRNLNHATSGTGSIYTDADNNWGDGQNYVEGSSTTAANGQTAAVDAHYGLQQTWDYYAAIHGRNGIDNAGTATYSRVHYSNGYDNAFWSDSCFCMTYGDGTSLPTLTSLDVAGHEMSHGVTSRTAGLVYRGESGGLNEATSDIFGESVEIWTNVPGKTGEWQIGEDLDAVNPIRYMDKPSRDGRSADYWYKQLGSLNVHYSSGPANHFYYYLVNGVPTSGYNTSPYLSGGMSGIGIAKAEKIWYRALTVYMTSRSKYSNARVACLNAAADLYGSGSAEYNAVNNAWKAVNVK